MESWLESGLGLASRTKREESKGVASMCKGVIVITGHGKDGRKWRCGLKNCWS